MRQRQGSWKLLVERVKDAQRRGVLSTPDQEIAYGTYHLLALMKLQDYRAAALELAAFGDLNAPLYRFENHPELYPEKSGQLQEGIPHLLTRRLAFVRVLVYWYLEYCSQLQFFCFWPEQGRWCRLLYGACTPSFHTE